MNCDTTSAAPADVEQRPVRPALVVAEDPQLGGLAGEVVGDRLGVVGPDAEQDREPGADRPDDLALDPHRARVDRWSSALTAGPGGSMTPCSAMNAARQASASALVGVARRRVALRDERLGRGRDEQVVVADAVGVHLAVAAEHDDRDAAGLDLVHEPPGEVLRQRGEA